MSFQQLPMSPLPKQERDLTHFPGLEDGGDGRMTTVQAAAFLVRYAEAYGLDAWQGHVLYYFGKPYITERGAVANATTYGKLYKGYNAFPLTPRRIALHGKAPGTYGWECEVLVMGRQPVREWGYVEPAEIDALKIRHGAKAQFLPIVNHPGAVARARAIRRSHILAFPLRRRGELPEGAQEAEAEGSDDEGKNVRAV